MVTNPKVSICVPIYGVEKFISKCADSLFKQTYENIEYIYSLMIKQEIIVLRF